MSKAEESSCTLESQRRLWRYLPLVERSENLQVICAMNIVSGNSCKLEISFSVTQPPTLLDAIESDQASLLEKMAGNDASYIN
eukprot:5022877-Amphidinium_carterae.1